MGGDNKLCKLESNDYSLGYIWKYIGYVVACCKDELEVIIHLSWVSPDNMMVVMSSKEEMTFFWTIIN